MRNTFKRSFGFIFFVFWNFLIPLKYRHTHKQNNFFYKSKVSFYKIFFIKVMFFLRKCCWTESQKWMQVNGNNSPGTTRQTSSEKIAPQPPKAQPMTITGKRVWVTVAAATAITALLSNCQLWVQSTVTPLQSPADPKQEQLPLDSSPIIQHPEFVSIKNFSIIPIRMEPGSNLRSKIFLF